MSTTILRQMDTSFVFITPSISLAKELNIASIVVSTLMLALAAWCRLRLCSAHNDKQRCRVVMIMSVTSASYSVCQIILSGQTAPATNHAIVRVCMFVSTFCLILNSFLIVGAIGLDSAVRYGLRSFGLARRLSGSCEIGCFICALLVTQPTLYLFSKFSWTGSSILVNASNTLFEAAVWMLESAWVALSMVIAGVLLTYSMVKANKIAKYTAGSSNASTVSVLGTAASIQNRVRISICYMSVFTALYIWKIAFRIGGSNSEWLFTAVIICEALQSALMLVVFIADILTNMRVIQCPEWSSASVICSSDSESAKSTIRRRGSKSFTSWRKTGFLEWQKHCIDQEIKALPPANDINLWIGQVKQCYIRSDFSHYEQDDYSVSDISYDEIPEFHPDTIAINKLTK
ncbi:hypothetical protein COEREDRAFT_8342 [Coemansia reversa NRRL 1564]|uniref:Uncharacterized protein n=1 Tax=Coemansia reversa (strain ATCC 12441 / NRRL 1564) TaxID=763665 RepID=A0A2G5BC13_COERN|nr:hypothetical protein COEREDRAFT_8342 [Coemansia reversa NRRL 1564]|eukprot:PIA16555.1 hypothetical protein COEREDRAFT_8342 [Coemansia reversa NRRL 1564]